MVASKVHFTKTVPDLEHFIDRAHIIKDLGGDDPYSYHYIEPSPGENNLLAETDTRTELLKERAAVVKEYERTTQEWIRKSLTPSSSLPSIDEEQEDKVVEQQLQEKRKDLAARLRSGYWKLDPYLRAQTLYDRLGMIEPGGKVRLMTGSELNARTKAGKEAEPKASSAPSGADASAAGTVAGHRDHDLD